MPEPSHTPFAGLIRIPPAQPLSANGFEFQYLDPVIVDRLLQLGAVTHVHDGAAAVATPGVAPTFAVHTEGGTIPGGEKIDAAYTLIDDDGGETLPSPISTKETASGGTNPGKAPTAVVSNVAGSLLAGSYTYGVTITDGSGGESILSPLVAALVEAGPAKAEVKISLLKKILEETGGKEWRLWRQQGGGLWNLIAQGTTEEKIDDGTLVPDCTVEPPLVSTTHGTASITLTVPNPAQPRATFFRLYATTTGSFGTVSLLGEFPAAEFGKALTFTALAYAAGQPPPVTRAYPHANKINPDTMLSGPWKKAVTKYSELPAEGNAAGDLRLVYEEEAIYLWNGTAKEWLRVLGEEIDGRTYAVSGHIPTGVQPGSYIAVKNHARLRLVGIMADIGVGEKVLINVRKNGVTLAEYKEVEVTKAFKEKLSSVTLADKDKLDIEVVKNDGEAERLSYTLLIGSR